MPRRPRIDLAGYAYHVLNRRVMRLPLFESTADYLAFESILADAAQRFHMPILSYCLMPNHWHLVLLPPKDNLLSPFMQWLTVTHMRRWHQHRHTTGTGPLYQGRFKSFPIQKDNHLLAVCRYVERNPLRSHLVKKAQLWPYSSLSRRHSATAQHPLPAWLLPPNRWPTPPPSNWLTRVNSPQNPREEQALHQSVHRGTPFGHPRWQKQTAAKLHLQSSLRPRGRPTKSSGDKRK